MVTIFFKEDRCCDVNENGIWESYIVAISNAMKKPITMLEANKMFVIDMLFYQ